jgi:excisionase family DNA binding protein
VPSELDAAVRRALEGANQELSPEMTVAQAAEYLGVPRGLILKLIRGGELPCHLVGKRRRIPTSALVAQNEKMFQEARTAAAEIVRIAEELGIRDMEGPMPKTR